LTAPTTDPTILLNSASLPGELKAIGEKALGGERISVDEGITLYEKGSLGFLGALANHMREQLHGDVTYFNRNFHIEPTNVCVFDCKFCSYSRNFKQKEDSWFYTEEEMLDIVKGYAGQPVTEAHIVGGVHPKLNLHFFTHFLKKIKNLRPALHVKAFTAVEYEYIFRKAKVSYEEGLQMLKASGLDSIPGGGAEIFHPEVREQICADKATSEQWLAIHKTAHRLGLPSNCTILYGHIESYAHRADHLHRLRQLQDRTGGFNAFIPLKFRNQDNQLSHLPEVTVIEDLKNYAVARIFLDNIPHLKAYWPMIGRETAQLALAFGVNDIDGTIDDTTKIYSLAGAEEQHPAMTTEQIVALIRQARRHPVERDSVYGVIKDHGAAPKTAAPAAHPEA